MSADFRSRGSFTNREWMILPLDTLCISKSEIRVLEVRTQTGCELAEGASITVESAYLGDHLTFADWGERWFFLPSTAGTRLRWWLRANGWTVDDTSPGTYTATLTPRLTDPTRDQTAGSARKPLLPLSEL